MGALGRSLHIGLNKVSPDAYGGWDGPLNACEADAEDLFAIAKAQGFEGKTLLTAKATRAAVLAELDAAASKSKAGDLFLFTNSSHGSQVVDKNRDEADRLDETVCLFDGQLIDDELFAVWSKFAPGVRVVVLSDSCHSGSVVRLRLGGSPLVSARAGAEPRPRCMPPELIGRAYRAQRALYDGLQAEPPKTEQDIQASVLLISGCQDPQLSMDGPFNGAFTGALLRVWNDGAFDGSYRKLHREIQRQLPITQQPNLMTLGNGKPFVTERPFTI